MCRTAGRRCPSYSDPAAIAARNARRRAAYAARKAAKKGGTSKNTVESVAAAATMKGTKKGTATKAPQGLGITRTPVPPRHLYTSETISGVLNHKALDRSSYRDFGFEDPTEGVPLAQRRFDDDSGTYSRDMSVEDTTSFTRLEENATRLFTGLHYEYVNSYAFHPEQVELMPDSTEEDAAWARRSLEDGKRRSNSKAMLKDLTDHLDSGLAKGGGRQRIVYRGINTEEILGSEADDEDGATREQILEWVDQERSLGTEVVFDGYTSTSVRPVVASNFSGDVLPHVVVYEILTPEGACVSSISRSPEEDEVLLPRKQRYTVVGVHKDIDFSGDGVRGALIQLVAINSKGEVLDGTNADPIDPLVP